VSVKQRDLLALTLFCVVLFGLRLGARDLWNPNEPIYGEAVAEMASRGDWLLPTVNGLVFAEKPILYFWLALLASKLLGGVSELSLRIPSLLAGMATVLGSYVLVRPYAGRARALTTAIACATLFGVFWNARFVQMDLLVTATTLWVVIAITQVVDHGAPPMRGFALAGVAAGLGFAAKGPVGWIGPGLTVLAYLAATKRLRALVRWELAVFAAVCLGVAAPWYLLLARSGHAGVLEEVLLRQNLARFVNPWDHRAPWWYYLQTFWIDMAPWGFFVPLAFRSIRRAEPEHRLALLSWIWIVATVGFFSLSKSKRSPYVLPIAPAVAVLVAEVAVAYATEALDRARRRWFLGIAAGLCGLFVAGGAVVLSAARWRLAAAAGPVEVFGFATLAAGVAVAIVLMGSKTRAHAPIALAAATAALYVTAATVTLPALNVLKSARPVCRAAGLLLQPGDEVVSYAFWNWRAEYRFYLGRPIVNVFDPEALRALWNGPKRVLLFVDDERVDEARQIIGGGAPAVASRVGGRAIYVFTSR